MAPGSLSALLDHPLVREVHRPGSRVGVMALHGGNLERATDVVATEVAQRTGASLYTVVQSPPLRHHVPSTAFDPRQSPALAAFCDHVDVVVSLHGYGRDDRFHDLLCGGTNRALARHVGDHLRARLGRRFRVVTDLDAIPPGLRGLHPDNPVNRPRCGGVQIELPPTVRWNRAARQWSDHLGTPRAPVLDQVIAALAGAVDSWPTPPPAPPTGTTCSASSSGRTP